MTSVLTGTTLINMMILILNCVLFLTQARLDGYTAHPQQPRIVPRQLHARPTTAAFATVATACAIACGPKAGSAQHLQGTGATEATLDRWLLHVERAILGLARVLCEGTQPSDSGPIVGRIPQY